MGVLCRSKNGAIILLRTGCRHGCVIVVTTIAMIVNACVSKPDRLRRGESFEGMVYPMGWRENQEKQQSNGGLQGQAAFEG